MVWTYDLSFTSNFLPSVSFTLEELILLMEIPFTQPVFEYLTNGTLNKADALDGARCLWEACAPVGM